MPRRAIPFHPPPTRQEFDVITRLMRTRPRVIRALELHLFGGLGVTEAAERVGMTQPSLSRSLRNFRRIRERIRHLAATDPAHSARAA